MVLPAYLESVKLFISKKKLVVSKSNDLNNFNKSSSELSSSTSKLKSTNINKENDNKLISRQKESFIKQFDSNADSDDSVIYESIEKDEENFLNKKCTRSTTTFKSNLQTSSATDHNLKQMRKLKESNATNKFISNNKITKKSDSSFNQNQNNDHSLYSRIKANRKLEAYPIKHQCIESKVIKTRLTNRIENRSKQICIHQSHPECLNLSNADEGCLVCNALTLGGRTKNDISFSSFKTTPSTTTTTANLKETNSKIKINQQPQPHRSLLDELTKLVKFGWYWGSLNRFEAENKLINTQAGTFLIRDSFDTNYILSLSFRINEGVFHTRIEYRSGYFHFYLQPNKKYETILELVNDLLISSKTGIYYYVKSKKTGDEIRFDIKLDKPLSRFTQLRSLKYLCRFVIKQNIRYDKINELAIPDSIKEYLVENHF